MLFSIERSRFSTRQAAVRLIILPRDMSRRGNEGPRNLLSGEESAAL